MTITATHSILRPHPLLTRLERWVNEFQKAVPRLAYAGHRGDYREIAYFTMDKQNAENEIAGIMHELDAILGTGRQICPSCHFMMRIPLEKPAKPWTYNDLPLSNTERKNNK